MCWPLLPQSFEYTKAAHMFLTTPTPSIISAGDFVFDEKKIPNGTIENVSFALYLQPNPKFPNRTALQTLNASKCLD